MRIPPSVPNHSARSSIRAFTLIELMVAMSVLCLIMMMLFNVISFTSTSIRRSNDTLNAFRSAREAFDLLSRSLSQATLDTYYDYYDSSRQSRQELAGSGSTSDFKPAVYGRYSDLHFISGPNLVPPPWAQVTHAIFFQAPLDSASQAVNVGLEGTLNSCGFFVAFGDDRMEIPSFLPAAVVSPKNCFRLYRMVLPTEAVSVYNFRQKEWLEPPLASITNGDTMRAAGVCSVAENILALIILPKRSLDVAAAPLAPDFSYDSRQKNWAEGEDQPDQMHQIPPLLEIAMVAVDETSAGRLLKHSTTSAEAQSALGINLATLFQSASSLDADLDTLGRALKEKNVGYRIFRTTIPLRSGKWN